MGVYRLSVVGESNYQRAVRKCAVGDVVDLRHEHNNPHDARAIAIATKKHGEVIGYAPRESWVHRAALDEGKDLFAWIDSVSPGEGSNWGVVLKVAIGEDAHKAFHRADGWEFDGWIDGPARTPKPKRSKSALADFLRKWLT